MAQISLKLFGIAALLFCTMPVLGQLREKPPEPPAFTFDIGRDGTTSEKAIAVVPMLNLSLCVTQGRLAINGVAKNELRVFVKNGSTFTFRPQESDASGVPASVIVGATLPAKPARGAAVNECLWGEDIQIDVPQGTTVNLKGRETVATIDSVRRVRVKVVGGDVSARNISEGVSISAGQGDITVEGSKGSMLLDSTTGNIVAFEVAPRETGDQFLAKTNGGTISLQQAEFRQMEASSISGRVLFAGKLLNGGNYVFGTENGSVRLSVPLETAARIAASYGFGSFNSELPLVIQTEDVKPGSLKSITGLLGKNANTTLRLITSNGNILIRKQ
jgi:hypothetical protein